MISISDPIKDTKQCEYYLAMARSGYYANAYDEPGYWAGKGAELLGLSGPVTQEVLQNLFDGFSPDGQTKLVQNAGSPDRQRAIDMAATPPKSFAVYLAMASPETRNTLWRLHREAVQVGREYLEEQAGLTRRGQGGKIIEPASMVFACFDHETSRANDPLPHTHLLAIHLAVREDGTTGTLYNHELYVHRAKADMIYKVHLALGLMVELGLKVEEEGHGFRIVGVPKEVCDVFSKRRAEVLDYLDEHGLSGPQAASIAAVKTRSAKEHIPREELFAEWQRIGRTLGWGPEEAAKLSRETKVRKLAAKYAHLLEPAAEPERSGNRSSEGRTLELSEAKPPEASKPGGRVVEASSTESGLSMNPRAKEQEDRSHFNHVQLKGPQVARERPKSENDKAWSSYDGREEASFGQGSMDGGADGKISTKDTWQTRKKSSLFQQVSRGNYMLKHARWGDVLWKVNLGIVEIRIQKKRLFRDSPSLNPASELAAPAIRIVPWRIKLFEKTSGQKRQEPKLLWKKALLLGELRLEREKLFHDAPWWSPIKNLEHTRLKVGLRSSEIPESAKKTKVKSEDGTQSQGITQSM